MTRYFFNLLGDPAIDDPEGTELADGATARSHAVETARSLIRRTKIFRENPGGWAVQVTDANGAEVAAVPFADVLSPEPSPCNHRGEFAPKLGWKIQLHIGQEVGGLYRGMLEERLPDELARLVGRLADRCNGGTG